MGQIFPSELRARFRDGRLELAFIAPVAGVDRREVGIVLEQRQDVVKREMGI